MTLRALFAFAGILTFTPAVAFLVLFRPPYGSLWGRLRHPETVSTAWWVGSSLRLLAAAVASGGFRILTTNILKGDEPVTFAGWFDKITTLVTLFLAAGASLLFFFVYLAFRVWPSEDDREGDS